MHLTYFEHKTQYKTQSLYIKAIFFQALVAE